jgi:hypothetical protein
MFSQEENESDAETPHIGVDMVRESDVSARCDLQPVPAPFILQKG